MSSSRWRLLGALAVVSSLAAAIALAAPNPNPPKGAGPVAAAAQEPPVDSIHVTDDGKGAGKDKDEKLGFRFLEKGGVQTGVAYGFKWTVTRANAQAMKKSTMKQEIFALALTTEEDAKGNKTYAYHVRDKGHPLGGPGGETGWKKAVAQWDEDKGVAALTVDGTADYKLEGDAEAIMKVFPAAALDGKQFSLSDFPGYRKLDEEEAAVGINMFKSFRITSELADGKPLTAVFQMFINITRARGGKWKKAAGETVPKLPHTWPEKDK